MKRGFVVFLRVIFILFAMLAVVLFGLKQYFVYGSQQAISQALVFTDEPVIGDTSAPFPIVEFYDYRCPHCSALSRIVDEAVDGDVGTKIVLRPVVVRDQESFDIAAFVLAVDRQKAGASVALHKAIMALGEVPSFEAVKAMAGAQGLDVALAEREAKDAAIRNKIVTNTRVFGDIGLGEVPALIIGDKGFITRGGVMPGVNELRLMMIDAKMRLGILK